MHCKIYRHSALHIQYAGVPKNALFPAQQVSTPPLYSLQRAAPPAPLLPLLPVCVRAYGLPLFTADCSPCSPAASV